MNTGKISLFIVLSMTGLVNAAITQTVFPLKISENKRYLVDQKDKPVPVLGRTAWCIISQPEIGYKKFIEHTLSFGYNAIEMSVICHWPLGNHPPFNGRGDVPFVKRLDGNAWDGKLVYKDTSAEAPDLTTPNERYWSYVDSLLEYCESKQILVFFFPGYVGFQGGDQGWMQELLANGEAKTQSYGAWIAERYKNRKNLVWMLLGDMGKFTPDQIAVEAALIKGLKSVPGQQSHYYSAEANSGQNSTDQVDFGKEMTLNGTYNWEHPIASLGRRAYAYEPVMPAYLLEEPYDEEGPDGNNYNKNAVQPVRRFQWWGWLSTIGGYVAGNGYIWAFMDTIWDKHLNTEGAKDMKRLNAFIKSIRWWELVPSGLNNMKPLIVDGGSCDTCKDYVAAAANPAGTLLVAYIPPAHSGNITVDMTALKSGVTGRWYDPSSGVSKKITGSPFINKRKRTFTPPGNNSAGQQDWVLVLER